MQFEKETVWLTQKQIAELFKTERSVISKHINNVFAEGKLKETNCGGLARIKKTG